MTKRFMKLPNGDRVYEGEYARDRAGRKVGPMVCVVGPDFGFDVAPRKSNGFGWYGDGRRSVAYETPRDLIAEWRDDDAPAHIITHGGCEWDLTALETPFGILQEKAPPVAEALKAWPHGVLTYSEDRNGLCQKWAEIKLGRMEPYLTYRAKPAPVEDRVLCSRGEFDTIKERGTCIKRADGSIDWATWEPET